MNSTTLLLEEQILTAEEKSTATNCKKHSNGWMHLLYCWKRWFLRGWPKDYKSSEDNRLSENPCGGGVEYLHLTLWVVGGNEKGSLKSETVK
jgi:hypothetical protein